MASLPNNQFSFGAHWIVDEERFASMSAVFRMAASKGFKGTQSALHARMKRLHEKGKSITWAELLKPLSSRWQGVNESKARAMTKRMDNDVIQAIANVERRKRELGLK